MRLYPNPSTGILRWSGIAEGSVSGLRVLDALSWLYLERSGPTEGADISVLPDGLYHVALPGEQGRALASGLVVLAK